MGLNRLLTKTGDIPAEWQQALDRSLGCRDWREAFYRVEASSDLFGYASKDRVKDASTGKFEAFLLDRFRTIFAGVAPETTPLRNRRRDRDGEPVREIARTYNVSHSTISRLTA